MVVAMVVPESSSILIMGLVSVCVVDETAFSSTSVFTVVITVLVVDIVYTEILVSGSPVAASLAWRMLRLLTN